jgi:hypothetical protein
LEIEFEIPEPLLEQLLIQAAEQEITVEKIIITAIQNYIRKGDSIADG